MKKRFFSTLKQNGLKALFAVFVLPLLFLPVSVDALTFSTNDALNFTNDNSVGTEFWENPEYAQDYQANYTISQLENEESTNYLKVTGFGFNIPLDATIDAIEVHITKKVRFGDVFAQVVDSIVSLVKGGTISGDNKASDVLWTNDDQTTTYGGSLDKWGLEWTPEDINSPDMGFVISAKRLPGSDPDLIKEPMVDYVNMTVYYTVTVPVVDTDSDGINDDIDNCPAITNADQLDTDNDGIGDVCDSTPNGDGGGDNDTDDDGTNNDLDNCPTIANADQLDTDGDGIGDACDDVNDSDNDDDEIENIDDSCLNVSNPDQLNTDNDSMGDACDTDDDNDIHIDDTENTAGSDPLNPNSTPEVCDGADNDLNDGVDEGFPDNDGDGTKNCVDSTPDGNSGGGGGGGGGSSSSDADGDTVPDSHDNCPNNINSLQEDTDGDEIGDACELDLVENTSGGSEGGSGQLTLTIDQESVKVEYLDNESVRITWQTSVPSSSYVIYSEEGLGHLLDVTDNTGNPPKYAYQHSTPEIDIDPKVTFHAVIIKDLNPDIAHYFRVVSREPFVYSSEYQFKINQFQETAPVEISSTFNLDGGIFETIPVIQNLGDQVGQAIINEEITEEPTSTTETIIKQEQVGFFAWLAGLTSAPGLNNLLEWIWQNILWLFILLLILMAIYYYIRNRQENKNTSQPNQPPQTTQPTQ